MSEANQYLGVDQPSVEAAIPFSEFGSGLASKPRTLTSDAWRRFRKHRLAMIGAAVLIFFILAVLLGSIFIVGLLCIGLYAVFIGPRAAQARQTEAARVFAENTQIVAQNTQVALEMTRAFAAAQETQVAQAATSTEEAIPDTATPQPTNTLVIAPTSTDTPVPTDTPPPTETLSPEQFAQLLRLASRA